MINIQDQFSVNIGLPIDKRIVANGAAARNNISYKYDGLLVFDTSDRRTYVWNSSSNAWGAADVSGSGVTNTLPKWSTSTGLTFSNIYITNVTNNYLGKVGVNTNGTTIQEVFQINSANTSSPPIVIHKGAANNIIGSNWYNNGTDQYFDSSIGSGIIKFRSNGEIWFAHRINGAGNPPINSSDTVSDDVSLILYPGTALPPNNGSIRIGKNTNFNWDGTSGSAAFIRVNNAFSGPSNPDYTWWYNDQVGFYHPGSNLIGVSVAGTQKAVFSSTGLLISAGNNITSPQRLLHLDGGSAAGTILQFTNGTTSGTGDNNGLLMGINSSSYPFFKSGTNNYPYLFIFTSGNTHLRIRQNQFDLYSNSNGENFATITASNGGGGSRVVRGTKLATTSSGSITITVETLLVPSSSHVAIEATFVTSKDTSPKQFVTKKMIHQYTTNSSGVFINQGGSMYSGTSIAMLTSSSTSGISNTGTFDVSTPNQLKMVNTFTGSGSGSSVVSFTAVISTIRGH